MFRLPYTSLRTELSLDETTLNLWIALYFKILRGCLPWNGPHTSSTRGERRQVLAKKQALSGVRWAEDYGAASWQFFDHIRGLGFIEESCHDQWELMFTDISGRAFSGQAVYWESERGWFDQLIPISKRPTRGRC